jgi:hypothetical protein
VTPLEAELRALIAARGPIGVADYMVLASGAPGARVLRDA